MEIFRHRTQTWHALCFVIKFCLYSTPLPRRRLHHYQQQQHHSCISAHILTGCRHRRHRHHQQQRQHHYNASVPALPPTGCRYRHHHQQHIHLYRCRHH